MAKRRLEEVSAPTQQKSKRSKKTDANAEPLKSRDAKPATRAAEDKALHLEDSQSQEQDTPQEDGAPKMSDKNGSTQRTATGTKKARFIVFIGNLPYTASTQSIEKHFSKIHPDSIRHITEKPAGTATAGKGSKAAGSDSAVKSKGFAFLEFTSFDRMKTCLKLYHHSHFDDGMGGTRKINVELTAGGGGKGEARSKKLKAKNAKLFGERMQRKTASEDAKAKKSAAQAAKPSANQQSAMHPSRASRMKAQ